MVDCMEPSVLGVDAEDSMVYAATYNPQTRMGGVSRFQWRVAALYPCGPIATLPPSEGRRPLAVMPAGQNCKHAHLVVGTQGSSAIYVLELPSLFVVHKHVLEGVQVMGLAADALPLGVDSPILAKLNAAAAAATATVSAAGGSGSSAAPGVGGAVAARPPEKPPSAAASQEAVVMREGAVLVLRWLQQALIVFDGATSDVLVLRWPLPGMSKLF
jgi:hypothetical protein